MLDRHLRQPSVPQIILFLYKNKQYDIVQSNFCSSLFVFSTLLEQKLSLRSMKMEYSAQFREIIVLLPLPT